MNNFTFQLDIVKTLTKIKSGDRIIVGYASTFDVDTDNAQITREALEGAKKDLLTYSTVLFNHDPDRPIGKVIDTEVDDIGLLIKVILSKEENEIWNKVQEGILNKFSIKGRGDVITQVGKNDQISQINKLELFEVSLVSVPANKEAGTISYWVAKSLNEDINNVSNKNSKMKKLLEKLKDVLEKDDIEEVKKEIEEIVKEQENDSNLIEKLQILSGKLSGEDKVAVDLAIELIKEKFSCKNEHATEQPTKIFDFADKSETRPVYQLNGNEEVLHLEEDNKFRKQLLKFGKWFHWDAEGGVLNITEEVIDNIIKNFKKNTIEHVYVPLTHTNDPAKNAGEVIKLEKSENGLDAIIEIKDDTVLEKIKKGLIKCVSASLDPNYRIKSSNKFAGPTLLHAALVSEPFIKGMRSFVPLTDEFSGRNVIQLEDEAPSFYSIMKALKDSLENIENKIITSDVIVEEFAKIKVDIGKQFENKETIEKEKQEPVIEKAKPEPVEGETCVIEDSDGIEGIYVMEEGNLICKSLSMEEIKQIAKSKYQECMSREMKSGKSMADAAKTCKVEAKKSVEKMFTSEAISEKKPEIKSEKPAQLVDFADAEKVYEGYLKQGKIVPAQKDTFIKLITSGKAIELGDGEVGVSDLLKAFMESQKSSIDFEENGVPVDDGSKKEEKVESDLSDMPAEAKDFFSKMGISDTEDMKKSWLNLKEMKKEEDDSKSALFD